MQQLGIFSWFSYDLPIAERMQLIKEAGFTAVSLWWEGEEKYNQPDIAGALGLVIDNIHTPYRLPNCTANSLWLEGEDGQEYTNTLIKATEDCVRFGIPTMVIHLTSFREPSSISEIGLCRIAEIVEVAEKRKIRLAFENLLHLEHLDIIFSRFSSEFVGFCYDSGHENLMHLPEDCLSKYGHRLFALHINDNCGDDDSHMLPFDGTIDWQYTMKKLKAAKPQKFFTLEVDWNRDYRRCSIYQRLTAEEYLGLAYEKASKLLDLKHTDDT
ncbi:MAG: sugar phosphate isomerase/epimerase [Oscillospiraceae bacterium]|nr:sugar phosphate isomerase/epimerase [Oscillospiraceae bacterium]